MAVYASWVKIRSFQENTFKWMKNFVEKINVTIQKYVYFPDTCVDNIKVMDYLGLRWDEPKCQKHNE